MMSSTSVHFIYDPITLAKRPNPSPVISLHDEIDEKLCGTFFGDTLECTITLRPGTELKIVDDAERLPFTSVHLTINLQTKSVLHFQSAIIDSDRTVLAEQAVTSTVHATEEKLTKTITFVFAGPHARADVVCTYLAGNKRNFKLTTVQDHRSPDTQSSLVVKGVFEGKAQFFCDNLIHIHKDAQRVDASQVNKNLLLSDTARAVSIPKMEVEADDVSCKHGAATSKMSDEHLFYLQSRGMSVEQSKELLIQAFLQ